MIALDTNVLLHSRRQELPHHAEARELLRELAEGDRPWTILWPCVYEFIRVITHPKVFEPPSELDVVLEDLRSLLTSPSIILFGEGSEHLRHLTRMVEDGQATGNLAHDAHIAALVREHGIRELWTLDSDFARFPAIQTHKPFQSK